MTERGSAPSTVTPLHARVRKGAQQRVRRATTNPFESGSERVLLVHCGYHKAATVWFRAVLLEVIRHYGLRRQEVRFDPIRPDTDLAFYQNCGSFHRDQVTVEKWVHRPNPKYGGLSHQEHLRTLSEHDGLMSEIEWFARATGAAMGAWVYHQPEFLELRYENAMADEASTFEKLFRWYGFNDHATTIGLDAVDRLSLRRGGAAPNHARSGRPGEWQTRLEPDHLERLRDLTDDLVVRLGYEDASG